MDKRHEEVYIVTKWGVLYCHSWWEGSHCWASGAYVHDDLEEAVRSCAERELVLERVAHLLPR